MNKKILLLYFNYQVKNYAGIKKAVPRKKFGMVTVSFLNYF